jgi:DNA-binding transcriptional ArsR family regulator
MDDAMPDFTPANLAKMKKQAEKASDFLKSLSHESRFMVICLLSEGERSVTELETMLSLRQPTVSQQLARLRTDGIVRPRRKGKAIYYSIANDDARRIITMLCEMFCNEGEGDREEVQEEEAQKEEGHPNGHHL